MHVDAQKANENLFTIGIFPIMMLCTNVLFVPTEVYWPTFTLPTRTAHFTGLLSCVTMCENNFLSCVVRDYFCPFSSS